MFERPISDEEAQGKLREMQEVLAGEKALEETSLSNPIIPREPTSTMHEFDKRQREKEANEIHRDN